ncbi:hypothetical protein M9Y10_006015 [Tritrichomonas musculus]|uniref:Initiator binding domain-containing protein n=1 Tax=Tritrichomonas musculus TaxID=1915356 RepID=A0ABR2JD31_9EUKA
MKRSYSYPNKSNKHRSSSVKANKNGNINHHHLFDEFRKDYDIFLDVELNKNYFSLRSFAMGGMPYFEMARVSYDTNTSQISSSNGKNIPQIIQDIIAGKLTPVIADLFKGINIQGKGIPCFISDSRKSITARYMLTLIDCENDKENIYPKSFLHFSSLSENEYSNDNESIFNRQTNNVNFKVLHTRKSSDIINNYQ